MIPLIEKHEMADKDDDDAMLEEIRQSLSTFEKKRSHLIPMLQAIQGIYKYLPEKAVEFLSEYLNIPESEVYGVATFYNQFRFNPPGKHPIKVCMGTACHVRGADIILENFERKLGIKEGETTPDKEFSIERVACVGCCALAPVAVIGESVEGHMAPSKVEGVFVRIRVASLFPKC